MSRASSEYALTKQRVSEGNRKEKEEEKKASCANSLSSDTCPMIRVNV